MAGKRVPFVDPETCIGCSACAAVCPDVFEMQPEGKSKAAHGEAGREEDVQRAIDTCPVQAISWKEKKE